MAVVWALPSMKRFAEAYPEVVFVDGTHKTNNESNPLVTFGIKDNEGKVKIILRCFVPNERD